MAKLFARRTVDHAPRSQNAPLARFAIGVFCDRPSAKLSGVVLFQYVDENHEIVLRLRRWGEAFVVENDSHYLFGSYICSMMLRGTLYGFSICGPKIDRTAYLPDERETVAALTHRVGIAYEWLTRGTANPVMR